MTLIAIVALIFIAVAIGVFALGAGLEERSAQARLLRQRLEAIDTAAARSRTAELDLLRDELLSEIPALNKLLSRSARVSRLQRFLGQADVKVRAGKFLLIALACGALVGLGALLWSSSTFLALLFGGGGAAIPFFIVSMKRARRFHKFEEMFPEAIDLLGRATRAGHAFSTALELIGTELGEPVAGEFRKLFEEQKFGLPIRDALLNLVERMPLVDVKFFVTAVLLQRETGGNLAEILDKLSYMVRERFKIIRQVRVFTAQGRLTLMILMALPPGLVVVMLLVNPDFIKPLFTDPMGHWMLAAGIVMQSVGYFLIRRIIHIQV